MPAEGWAILLTNDSSYWKSANDANAVDSLSRLHNGRSISGTLAWSAKAAPGTIRTRESPVRLTRAYSLFWTDYSVVSHSTYGAFRYLALSVL